jgi:hypothetical protein
MHYKAPDNSLHFLGDDSFAHLLPAGSVPITDAEAEALRPAPPPAPAPDTEALRKAAYREESDPLFFKWQRGEATEQEWIAAVNAIKARYPEPT